ncbi:sensor histidine kinase [Bailinhaonella thermotolerans]|uniref:sensor histidine kinase n=1 Tax=Bailinhaonella thermotolerans TaxID=1070861 RepID=UPI001F5B96CC|nr:histidine kinase [Bailinhaonella thermotolerans]
MRGSWERLGPWAPAAAALGAGVLPGLWPGHGLLAPGGVPGLLLAVAFGVAGAAAARLAPVRLWPLLALTATDALWRGPGPLLAVTSYLAAAAFPRPARLAAYAAAASVLAALPRPGVELASALGGAPLLVWLPLALGLWAGARRQVVAGLRERAERLEREQAALAGRARAQERARIARDMHDVLAHRVSLMVLRAGALEINAADPATAAEAELIRATGKEALTQLRAVLEVLGPRDGEPHRPQPTLADLEDLLEQSRAAGVRLERRDEGPGGDLPVMVQHAAYRVVQEALTNIHKHAGPVRARVALRRLPAALEVTVTNAPPPPGRPGPGAGFGAGTGLVGLRERVALLGGEFAAGPMPGGGFTVQARFPA